MEECVYWENTAEAQEMEVGNQSPKEKGFINTLRCVR